MVSKRFLRRVLDGKGPDVDERVQGVLGVIEAFGLTPPVPIEPLPLIDLDDMHLVT